jgi:hypothetical protein
MEIIAKSKANSVLLVIVTFKDLKKRVGLETTTQQQYKLSEILKISHFGFEILKSTSKKT